MQVRESYFILNIITNRKRLVTRTLTPSICEGYCRILKDTVIEFAMYCIVYV